LEVSSVNDLEARGAPIEYWFFKFNEGDLAFLVDFIIRREREQAEVRISLWVDGHGRVEHTNLPTWSTQAAFVTIGECSFGDGSTRGVVKDVEWDLSYEVGQARVHPAVPPMSWLHPFDTDIVNRPQARFAGTVRVDGRQFSIPETQGLVSHYWGRGLMDRWCWISVNGFDEPGIALEAIVARSRLWGLPAAVKIGYLWLQTPASSHLVISPVNGIVRVIGRPDEFTVTSRSITGRTVRLSCTASMNTYNDLGDGIRQTLLGTCAIDGVAKALGSAGLEWRLPEAPPFGSKRRI
jgi:hypothetical protein